MWTHMGYADLTSLPYPEYNGTNEENSVCVRPGTYLRPRVTYDWFERLPAPFKQAAGRLVNWLVILGLVSLALFIVKVYGASTSLSINTKGAQAGFETSRDDQKSVAPPATGLEALSSSPISPGQNPKMPPTGALEGGSGTQDAALASSSPISPGQNPKMPATASPQGGKKLAESPSPGQNPKMPTLGPLEGGTSG